MIEGRQPRRSPLLLRASALALGCLLALALLEGGLRVAGALLSWQGRRGDVSDGTWRILCVGESTTVFGDSPASLGGPDSYPGQLQSLLDPSGARVRVINRGRPGIDTAYIVENLEQWLDELRPHVVVAMMGINDDGASAAWSLGKPPGDGGLRFLRILDFALTQIAARWHGDPPATAAPKGAPPGNVAARERELRAAPAEDVGAAVELGTLLLADARPADAVPVFRAVLAREPGRLAARIGLIVAEHFDGPEPDRHAAIEAAVAGDGPRDVATRYAWWFEPAQRPFTRHAISAWPGARFAETHLARTYLEIAYRYTRAGRLDDAAAVIRARGETPGVADAREENAELAQLAMLRGDLREFDAYRARANALRTGHDSPTTRRNYRRLHDVLRARGIPLVAVAYPLRPARVLREMLDDAPDVLYVDSEDAFSAALRRASFSDLFWDAFAGDFGHATAAGNAILARQVAAALRSAGLAGDPSPHRDVPTQHAAN